MMDSDSERLDHLPDEATPKDVSPLLKCDTPDFGLHDSSWTDVQWLELLNKLVAGGVGSWKDIAALVLGHLNPSQVGTSLASSDGFKRRYGKGNTMKVVMDWVYNQTGRCMDCGSRLELQADHIKGREEYTNPLDADFIENMTLRCRRCNVVRRPSHEFGGLTFLTAEAALMWILIVIRPRSYFDYLRMCRLYGMTMSDIRMQEAWAMAHWLSRADPPAYGIEDDANTSYDLILWSDAAITRVDVGYSIPSDATRIYSAVLGTSCLGFLTLQDDGRMKLYEQQISFLPFSTYGLGERPPQALCIKYTPPDRSNSQPQKLNPLAPRNSTLLAHQIKKDGQHFKLVEINNTGRLGQVLPEAPHYGKLITSKIAPQNCRIISV